MIVSSERSDILVFFVTTFVMSDVLFLVSFSNTKISEISDVTKCLESFVSQALVFFMNKFAAELR